MGHKVNPVCLRIGLHRTWTSRWFAPSKRQFREYIAEDLAIRDLLREELASAAVSRIEIERSPDRLRVVVHTARPGVLIGRRGENIQRLQDAVQRIIGTHKQLKMDYIEITNPYVEAQLVAESIAFQLEKRVAHRRAMKRSMQQAQEAGGKGIKIVCDGRLSGSEMTRRETYRAGRVPLGTLRADIDYGDATAQTAAGCIGVKVWVYRGDIVPLKPEKTDTRPPRPAEGSQSRGGPTSPARQEKQEPRMSES